MRLIKQYALALLVSMHAVMLYASPASDLNRRLDATESLQANFTQTVYDNRGKAVQRSYGKMALLRPGKFRWEVQKPIPQLVIANGARLWIYDPDLEQVTIRALHQATGETPALMLSQQKSTLDTDYKVTTISSASNEQWYRLVPRQSDSLFESIKMGFKGDTISAMTLEDHLGHTTKIVFSKPIHAMPAAALFEFKPPKGVDVIDETSKHH